MDVTTQKPQAAVPQNGLPDGVSHGLSDDKLGGIVIGRTAALHAQFGNTGLSLLGTVADGDGLAAGTKVFQDIVEPHVQIIVGVRGSGKSYSMGNVIEALAMSRMAVGVVVVDRCGAFLRMTEPNPDPEDAAASQALGLDPQGLRNLVLFSVGPSPAKGARRLVLRTSALSSDDWANVMMLPPESPRRELIRVAIEETQNGYVRSDSSRVPAKAAYGLADLAACLHSSRQINNPRSGYAAVSIRSLAQRIGVCARAGGFDKDGTPVTDLVRPGQVTVIDLSDSAVDDITAAKVAGVLARGILAARQASVRTGREIIPVTWLCIDEAHLFVGTDVPSETASDLITYCKLGRKPGCALILGTQQPSALHQSVVSQADIVVAHRLVFAQDIACLRRMMPSALPSDAASLEPLIRGLPVGSALVGDKCTQGQVMVVKMRPRLSAHNGASSLPRIMAGEEAVGRARSEAASLADEGANTESAECSVTVETPVLPEQTCDDPVVVPPPVTVRDVASTEVDHGRQIPRFAFPPVPPAALRFAAMVVVFFAAWACCTFVFRADSGGADRRPLPRPIVPSGTAGRDLSSDVTTSNAVRSAARVSDRGSRDALNANEPPAPVANEFQLANVPPAVPVAGNDLATDHAKSKAAYGKTLLALKALNQKSARSEE